MAVRLKHPEGEEARIDEQRGANEVPVDGVSPRAPASLDFDQNPEVIVYGVDFVGTRGSP
jgi:hypothetical protein